jgi:endonuclease G, mitochondrial
MNHKAAKHSSTAVTLLVTALLAILIAGALYAACQYNQRHERALESQSASQPAGLISDDRIIFAGIPRSTRLESEFTLLKNTAYIVGYSESRKDPLWSAYHLIKKENPFLLDRPKGEFLTDLRTTARVSHHDFTGSMYDRGHMTPNSAIAKCFGHQAQLETFLLSNICPQAPALNQKVWEKLEAEELHYAERFGEIWIIDGPIFADLNGGATHTLRTDIAIPTAFYKIILEDHAATPTAFAVIIPQTVKGTELPAQYITTIDNIEHQTALEFFWKLHPQTRTRLVSKTALQW